MSGDVDVRELMKAAFNLGHEVGLRKGLGVPIEPAVLPPGVVSLTEYRESRKKRAGRSRRRPSRWGEMDA